MFNRILVGYDGSARSKEALTFARTLADATGAGVVAVWAYWYEPLSSAIHTDDLPSASPSRVQVERSLNRLSEAFDVETRAVVAASPARALGDAADAEAADVIVLGSSGRRGAGAIFGTIAQRLLHQSSPPVAVVPEDYRARFAGRLARIGVAWREDLAADRAIQVGHELASRAHADLSVIRVFDPAPYAAAGGDVEPSMSFAAARRDAGDQLDRAIERLPEGAPVHGELPEGPPVDVLVERAIGLDLLVMGSRAHGPFRRVLLGSVSTDVSRRCSCPVLVVPPDSCMPDRVVASSDRSEAEAARG